MTETTDPYAGREQAKVKHYFLATYLESLVHKTAARFDEITYVDGFSGPWQSTGEGYKDTSFGVALSALRAAKESWKKRGREVRMSAHLVESAASSFSQLQQVPPKFPDIAVHAHHGDFVALAPRLRQAIPENAFAFVFIDPKGWRIDTKALQTLFDRPNTEVVFNFMFDFINRAASISDPKVVRGLSELMPIGAWQEGLKSLGEHAAPSERKSILIDAFSSTLDDLGGFDFVLEMPVLRPLSDRILYSLVYATRKAAGVQVFRDCQIKALREQSSIRGKAKLGAAASASGQTEMFGSLAPLGPDENAQWLLNERWAATATFLSLVPVVPSTVRYGDVWPDVLARHVIRRVELNQVAASLRKAGTLVFPDWRARQRVPEDSSHFSKVDTAIDADTPF